MAANAIPCTFSRGCSAAAFIFRFSPVVNLTYPLPLFVDRGGFRGGGTILACLLLLHGLKNRRIEALMRIFATQKAVAELAFRLGELDSEVRELKTARKHLELEWEELYDKVRRQMARMSKRYAVDAKENGEIPPVAGEELAGDEMDPISARIHERRSRGFLQQ